MSNDYTIVGWRKGQSESAIALAYGDSARQALDDACRRGDLSDDGAPQIDADYQLIAVLPGVHYQAASASDIAGSADTRVRAAREEQFTILGYWVASGECFCDTIGAQSAVQAMRMSAVRVAGVSPGRELQLVCAFQGAIQPSLRRENCPEYW